MEPVFENSFIKYPIFSGYPGLVHFTTTRQTFSDPAPKLTGEDLPMAERNLKHLSSVTGIEISHFVIPRQTHSNNIQIIESTNQRYIPDTDALITQQKGICICVQTADCVPILIFDPAKNVVAVVHAGWRGTVSRIVQKTVETMVKKLGSNPDEMIVAIGPSISPGVYEVGEDVYSQVIKKMPEPDRMLATNGNGKMFFNLWEANRLLLLGIGISPKNISCAELCTYSLPELFFSARYSGQDCGRIVSAMMLTRENQSFKKS